MSLIRRALRGLHAPIYRRRVETLVACILPHLRAGDHVLDVGCGFGGLGRALLDARGRPDPLDVRGLERVARDEHLIPIETYDGGMLPYANRAFDVVILADVLHHEADPHALLEECARVADRLVIVKDHALEGFLARGRVGFIDWAANAPYGVPCRYEYNRLADWHAWHERHGLRVREERTSMRLYPPLVNLLFGRRLQYFAVLEPRATDSPRRHGEHGVSAER